MSEHTPGPWGLYVDDEAFLIQRTSDFSPVARTVSRSAEAEANAKFIMRACNSHEELLEALRYLRNEAHGLLSLEREAIIELVGRTNVACLEDKLHLADTVLAKAEG